MLAYVTAGRVYYSEISITSLGVAMVNCAKCGKVIPAGEYVVKKGFIRRKSYHKECPK